MGRALVAQLERCNEVTRRVTRKCASIRRLRPHRLRIGSSSPGRSTRFTHTSARDLARFITETQDMSVVATFTTAAHRTTLALAAIVALALPALAEAAGPRPFFQMP